MRIFGNGQKLLEHLWHWLKFVGFWWKFWECGSINHMHLTQEIKSGRFTMPVALASAQFLDGENAKFSKSCNLIGSGRGRFFTILPAYPGKSLFVACESAKTVIFTAMLRHM